MYLEVIRGYDKTLIRKKDLQREKLQAIQEINECLDSVMTLCSINNIKFMAITHAAPLNYCYDRPDELDVRLFNKMQNKYPHIYIEDQLREIIKKENCLEYGWKNDGHFTGKGYVALGQLLYEEIQFKYPDFFKTNNQFDME